MGQGVVEEGLMSFGSGVGTGHFWGLRSLERTSLVHSGGRRVCGQILIGHSFNLVAINNL